MSPGRIFVKKLETIAFCIFAYPNLFTTFIGNITQRLQFLCNCHFLNFFNFSKIDCRILFTVTCHGTLFDTKRVMRMMLLKK